MKRMILYLLSLIMALMLGNQQIFSQDPPQYGSPFSAVPYRMDANIYQLNIREYSATRDIAGARANLSRISDLGINVLYLMPIYPIGTTNSSGSPYCISDLTSVDPDLGTLSDLRALVEDAHNLGMAVIFDWVANQTSWDHPWITEHPDWYVRDGNGDILPPCPSPDYCFTDVAHLDLNNTGAANAMVEALRYWIFAANIDGYRFDWADKAPPAFWTNTINDLRGITSHDLLLLAEGSNEGSTSGCTTCGENEPGYHYDQGFDYIFGTNFYWNVLKKIWNSGEPVTNLDGVTAGEYYGADNTQLVARFLSNHDDYNADGSPFSFLSGGRNAAMSAFVVATYHRGVPFIYNGLEVGNTNPLPYPWNSGSINWTQDMSVYTEMQAILTFRNNSMAIKRGQPVSYIDPANTNPDVIAFTKESGSEKVAVLVNVRNGTRTFTIPSGMAGNYNDAFTGSSVSLTTGASVSLSAYEYLVLSTAEVEPIPVEGISLSPTSIAINQYLSQQLTASVIPSNASNQNITWSSANASIATVDGGLVTGVNPGTTTITARTEEGDFMANCQVTVTQASQFTVNFYKPDFWSTGINIYYWNTLPDGAVPTVSWPGVTMSEDGDGWFSYTFVNVSSTNLIFNDGTNQTADLQRSTTGWYKDGVWTDSKPDVTPPVDDVPSPWQTSDIGSVSATGLATYDNGTFTVKGSGADIWEAADEFRYVYQQISGDVSITSRVVSLTNTNDWAKAGVMIRNALSNDAVHALTAITFGNGTAFQRRTIIGGNSSHTSGPSANAPYWVRLERSGNTFTSYVSTNGSDWTTIGSEAINMNTSVYIGLAVTSHSDGALCTSLFDNVTVSAISNVPVTGVSVSPSSFSINVGNTQQLTETVLPSDASDKTVVWSSSNTAVATVDNGGLVTGVASGQATITVQTNDGNYTATSVVDVTEVTGSYFAIENRWQGTYLYDAGDYVAYGGSIVNNNYLWEKVEMDATYFWLKNAGTGEYMHIENQTGYVQSSNVSLDWWSSQWSSDYIDGTWIRIRNRWQTGSILHVENQNGFAEYSGAQDIWWSAQWTLVPTSSFKAANNGFILGKKATNLTIYPNPAPTDFVTIEGPDVIYKLQLLDIAGRVVLELFPNDISTKIAINDLTSGIYVIKADIKQSGLIIQKLLVE